MSAGRRRSERPATGAVPAGIARAIMAEGGRVTFARFMELALTHPEDGYYSRVARPLGARGHFTTAPCLSRDFNEAVGRLVTELAVAAAASAGETGLPAHVVELGAGRGDLARAVVARWEREALDLRDRISYTLVDVSPRLQAAQRRAVAGLAARGWRVGWAGTLDDALAAGMCGAADASPGEAAPATPAPGAGARPTIVLGNEFLDALPVHLVDVRTAEPLEAWVGLEDSEAGAEGGGRPVREIWAQLSEEAFEALRALFGTAAPNELRAWSRDGTIEVRPAVGGVLERLAGAASAACLVTIDYGAWRDPRACAGPDCAPAAMQATVEPHRRTLRGYFRHQLVNDPYVRIGAQDLTADVDFAALHRYGRRAGFETVLYTTVAALLRADGAEAKLAALRTGASRSLTTDRRAAILERLLDDEGLGGAFKVMLQARG